MAGKRFDSACRELADHFIDGNGVEDGADASDAIRDQLAQVIQNAVEDWFEHGCTLSTTGDKDAG